MIAFLLASVLAFGSDIDRYPLRAEVALPAEGTVRIDVPPALRTAADPADASDMLLVNAAGEIVPVARLVTSRKRQRVRSGPLARDPDLAWWPTEHPHRYRVRVAHRALDGLRLRLPSAPAACTVQVLDDTGALRAPPVLLWRTPIDAHEDIEVPLPPGESIVQVTWHGHRLHLTSLEGYRHLAPRVDVDRLQVPVASRRVQEDGWARYDVILDRALPVSRVHLQPVESLFERQAAVVDMPRHADPGLVWEPRAGDTRPIQRIQIGDADVDAVTLDGPSPGDRFAVLVDARRRTPLDIGGVIVELEGVHLVARDPGPGPHLLYGGAPAETSPIWDLDTAIPELARMQAPVVTPSAPGTNPAWIPPEVRARLADAAVPVELERFAWVHPLEGVGLVRVALDDVVLAGAREDLGDLRVVDAEGRQIPYVLRPRGGSRSWGELPFARRERGGNSLLEVPLPHANARVATLTLGTSAPVFQRQVTLLRPRGGHLEPVRSFVWTGADRPGQVTLDVRRRLGDTLVVQIANGDDPPLPIDVVEASWPAWEIVARLPAGGARLIYGDLALGRPDYDLALLEEDLVGRAVSTGSLGPRAALEPPPPSLLDRLVLLAGLVVLAGGLLRLTIALIRAVPEEEVDEAAATA